jgi:hypothetical protein
LDRVFKPRKLRAWIQRPGDDYAADEKEGSHHERPDNAEYPRLAPAPSAHVRVHPGHRLGRLRGRGGVPFAQIGEDFRHVLARVLQQRLAHRLFALEVRQQCRLPVAFLVALLDGAGDDHRRDDQAHRQPEAQIPKSLVHRPHPSNLVLHTEGRTRAPPWMQPVSGAAMAVAAGVRLCASASPVAPVAWALA